MMQSLPAVVTRLVEGDEPEGASEPVTSTWLLVAAPASSYTANEQALASATVSVTVMVAAAEFGKL